MKYAILGANRVAKDFLYIFDKLEITMFFDDVSEESMFMGQSLYPLKKLESFRKHYDKLILCDFDKAEKIAFLIRIGFKEDEDYIKEETFFRSLEGNPITSRKKMVVWGTGKWAEELVISIDIEQIQFFVDSYSKEEYFYGKKIVRPNNLRKWNDYVVIVAVSHNEEIYKYLNNHGLVKGEDYCSSKEYLNSPEVMLRKTIFERNQYELKCRTMLNHLEVISGRGECICCCSTFNKTVIGKLDTQGIDSIWNSSLHKILCLSNVNQTYSFCDKNMCPFFIEKTPTFINIDEDYSIMEKHPINVAVSFDYSCNLKCITCRKDICLANKEERLRFNKFSEAIKKEILPYTEFYISAGNGETFLSESYRKIYLSEAIQNIKLLRFLSNGLLFSPEKWRELRNYYHGKVSMTISIDAATKETYEKIRAGGIFERLVKNMKFASQLRSSGELSYLRFNFVVQRENYHEMIKFVEWGEELGIDEVFFTKILNWGTYSQEDFKRISMFEDDGITPKAELKEVLDNPVMKKDIVDLGTIRLNHEPIKEMEIDNYYRWELQRRVSNLI